MLLQEIVQVKLPNVWYHATTPNGWEKIKKSGQLLGKFKAFDPKTFDPKRLNAGYKWTPISWITNDLSYFAGPFIKNQIILQLDYTPKQEDLYHTSLTKNLIDKMIAGEQVVLAITKPIPLSKIKPIKYLHKTIYKDLLPAQKRKLRSRSPTMRFV